MQPGMKTEFTDKGQDYFTFHTLVTTASGAEDQTGEPPDNYTTIGQQFSSSGPVLLDPLMVAPKQKMVSS